MIRDAPGRRKATEEAANEKLPAGSVKLIQFILWVQLILCGALDAATAARLELIALLLRSPSSRFSAPSAALWCDNHDRLLG
jgi:hypothetical protein